MCLTADGGPQVESHGAVQRLVRSAEGVEEEETAGHRGEEDDSTTEEDDGGMEARRDGAQQVWEDWERRHGEEGQTEEHLMFDGEQKVLSSTSCWLLCTTATNGRRERVALQQNSHSGATPEHLHHDCNPSNSLRRCTSCCTAAAAKMQQNQSLLV